LLNHSSGIVDYLDANFHIDAVNEPFYMLTQEEKISLIHGKKAEFLPGEKYEYSNSNYVLLGLLVEELRNLALWDAVDQYIVEPLGLHNTVMDTHAQPLPEGTARPCHCTGNLKYIDMYQNSVSDAATGDGGIASCTQDLIIFLKALINGDLVSQSTYELMRDERIVVEAGEDWYGLGLEIGNGRNGLRIGHTGSTSSYNGVLFYYPERDTYLSVALNGVAETGPANQAFQEAWGDLMDKAFE